MLSDLQLVYMVPRKSTQLLNINTTKFQVDREPVYFSSISNTLLWSMVSKAADRSRRTRNDPFPLPIVVTIICNTLEQIIFFIHLIIIVN